LSAPIRQGRVLHVWDHFVLDLRAGDHARAFLSLYAIGFSPSIGAAQVALLKSDSTDGRRDLLLTDDPAAARRMRDRLRALGYGRSSLDVEPTTARFGRTMTAERMIWRIEWDQSTATATWSALEPAFQLWAPAPQLVKDEDIAAVFVEAAHARLEIDGRVLEADVAMDNTWVPKVGRPLFASHAALAEVRVKSA
jgi:hypothetical protein